VGLGEGAQRKERAREAPNRPNKSTCPKDRLRRFRVTLLAEDRHERRVASRPAARIKKECAKKQHLDAARPGSVHGARAHAQPLASLSPATHLIYVEACWGHRLPARSKRDAGKEEGCPRKERVGEGSVMTRSLPLFSSSHPPPPLSPVPRPAASQPSSTASAYQFNLSHKIIKKSFLTPISPTRHRRARQLLQQAPDHVLPVHEVGPL